MLKYFKNLFDLNEPLSGTSEQWQEWNLTCKKNKPIIYWLREVFPDYINLGKYYRKIKNYIRFRTLAKYHIIDTGLKPNYYDKDTILLHGMFSLLVDFIENEKAHMYIISNNYHNNNLVQFWKKINIFRNRYKYKNKIAGLAYLSWEMTLNGSQAESAKEQYELYKWWTEIRPSRLDSYDAVGLTKWLDKNGRSFGLNVYTAEQQAEKQKLYNMAFALEESEHNEDTEMLIRLIKIRDHLWT